MSKKNTPLRLNIYLDTQADPEFEYLVAMEQRGYRGFEAIRLMKLGLEYDEILKQAAKARSVSSAQAAPAPQQPTPNTQPQQQPINPVPAVAPNVQPPHGAPTATPPQRNPVNQNTGNRVASQAQRATVETQQPPQSVRQTNAPVPSQQPSQQQRPPQPVAARPPSAPAKDDRGRAVSKLSSFMAGGGNAKDVEDVD